MPARTRAIGLTRTGEIALTGEDLLGMKGRAKAMAKFLVKASSRLTVSISGDWGAGKTSFMNMVFYHLSGICEIDKKRRLAVARPFEAWRHEQQQDILGPYYRGVRSDAATKGRKAAEWAEKIGTVTALSLGGLVTSILEAATQFKIGGLGPAKIKKIGDAFEKGRFLTPNAVEKLKECFEKLSKDTRVIVMVDDLDRCFPDSALQIIESLKLLLDIRNFVYVLAIQQQSLEQALVSRFARLEFPAESRQGLARDYLDKLIDVEYKLPELGIDRACSFLTRLKIKWLTGVDKALMLLLLPCNPRVLARAVNAIELKRELIGRKTADAVPGALTKCWLLEHRQKDVFARLRNLPDGGLAKVEQAGAAGPRTLRELADSADNATICGCVHGLTNEVKAHRDVCIGKLQKIDPAWPNRELDDGRVTAEHTAEHIVLWGPAISSVFAAYANTV